MPGPAHISSLDAIRDFRQDLCRYAEAVQETLEGLGIEVRRGQQWVEQDRASYWPREVRRAEDQVVAARSELSLAKMAALRDQHKSCIDEVKRVERAVDRQRLCEHKIRQVKHWRQAMHHQVDEFSGRISKLKHYLETDIPRALAALDRVILAVEKYTETRGAHSPQRTTRHQILDEPEAGPSKENR